MNIQPSVNQIRKSMSFTSPTYIFAPHFFNNSFLKSFYSDIFIIKVLLCIYKNSITCMQMGPKGRKKTKNKTSRDESLSSL